MACQIVVTAIFAFYIMKFTDVQMTLKIPFVSGYELNAGILTVPLLFFVVIGTVNGVTLRMVWMDLLLLLRLWWLHSSPSSQLQQRVELNRLPVR